MNPPAASTRYEKIAEVGGQDGREGLYEMSKDEQGEASDNPTQSPTPRQLMSLADAADYLGVSTRTIRSYIARGVLKANRIHGSRLIRIDSAEL